MSHLIKGADNSSRWLRSIFCVAGVAAMTVPLSAVRAQTVGAEGNTPPATATAASNAVPVIVRNPASDTNLLYYAAQGDLPKFQKFLQRGGSVQEARRKDGKTVLMLAANKGSLPIVEIALKEGADVNDTDTIDMSALMLASRGGFVDIVTKLIQSGATVENRNVNGMTALMLAVQSQKPEVVDALIANGANVNTKDDWGNTPLMLAAGGQPGIVQSLLKAGADVNVRNSIGKTALGLAVAKKNEAVAAQLRTAGGFE